MTAGLDAEGEQLLAWLKAPSAGADVAADEDAALTRTLLAAVPARAHARTDRATGPSRGSRRPMARPLSRASMAASGPASGTLSALPRATAMEATVAQLAPSLGWGQVQEIASGWTASVRDTAEVRAWCQAGLSVRDFRTAAACAQRGLTPEVLGVRVEGARVAARLRGGESLDAVIGLLQATGKWSPPRP
jgi:hypothetical protein